MMLTAETLWDMNVTANLKEYGSSECRYRRDNRDDAMFCLIVFFGYRRFLTFMNENYEGIVIPKNYLVIENWCLQMFPEFCPCLDYFFYHTVHTCLDLRSSSLEVYCPLSTLTLMR